MKRRIPGAFVASAVAHVVGVAALAYVLSVPSTLARLFDRVRGDIPAERIGMIALPSAREDVPGRIGGDARPVRESARQREMVAPTTVPVGIPAPSATISDAGGSGPLVGTGGPTQGVRPAYRDPRLWREPRQVVSAPRSVRETIESIIAADIGPIADSIAVANARRSPRDWTFEKGGHKWGLDSSYIRLGPVSIPTALLALLPVNAQANPTQIERDRSLSYMNRDINWHARRAMNEDEFRRAVRNLRERKERERGNEKERRTESPAAPSNPQTN